MMPIHLASQHANVAVPSLLAENITISLDELAAMTRLARASRASTLPDLSLLVRVASASATPASAAPASVPPASANPRHPRQGVDV
jgi:hypothetical protein